MRDFLSALERICQKFPEQTALASSSGLKLSYAELWQQLQAIGSGLQARGIKKGELVGITYGRSPEFVLALLACWQAGACWLPLADLPKQRLEQILKRTQPKYLLGPELPLEQLKDSLLQAKRALEPQDPAYLIFTSGSSGQPKGVLLPHAGIVSMLQAQIDLFGLNPASRSLWLLSPLFDASLSDIGSALLSAACLVIDPEPLRDLKHFYALLNHFEISYLDLPPALLSALEPERLPASLKTLVIGGEAARPEQISRWARRLRLINVYGPTEATVCTSAGRCQPGDSQLLGQPLPGVEYRLDGQIPQAGQAGELWIHAQGLALGYWQAPALNAERFVEAAGKRWYRSGDRVELTSAGAYRFIGRLDRQFKYLGRLLCPEEIESRLLQHPDLERVLVCRHRNGSLLGCLQARGDNQPAEQELRDWLAAQLPEWMIPQVWLWPDPWPLSASGKSDSSALSNWPLKAAEAAELTADESLLAAVWQRLFRQDISAESDFFSLGGSSIEVLSSVALAAQKGLFLSPESFYRGRSLRQIMRLNQSQKMPIAEILASLPELPVYQGPTVASEIRSLLLTGATGFLGSRLLAELLRQTDWQIICLVRAADSISGWFRLIEALRPWGLIPPADRLQVIPGDLCDPQLKLNLYPVDAVLHCAAQVDLVRDYASLYQSNLAALKPLTALNRPLHLVSSLSVLVSAEPRPSIALESDDLSAHLSVSGGYAQSKWAAEACLRRWAGPQWIYRPGLITPDPLMKHKPQRDWLSWLIQGLLELGSLPDLTDAALALDISPVDFVAKGIVELMQQAPDTYHLANPQSLSLKDLLRGLARWAGLPLSAPERWQQLAQTYLQQAPGPQASAALLALCKALRGHYWQSLNLFQATGIQLASEQTLQQLAKKNILCPQADQVLLERYFEIFVAD